MYIYRLKDGNLIINAFDLETELIAADAVNMHHTKHKSTSAIMFWQENLHCGNQSSQSASEIHQAREAAWTATIAVLFSGRRKKEKEKKNPVLNSWDMCCI